MSFSDEEIDQLLRDSGELWRNSEPSFEPFSVETLVRVQGRAARRGFSLRLGAAASLAVVALAAVSLLAIYFTGPLGSAGRTSTPSQPASLTAIASSPIATLTAPPASPSPSPSPSPTTDPGYAACSAILDNIPLTVVKSGSATLAAAYRVTGQELTSYFEMVLKDGPMSNGSDWWGNPAKTVDMCLFDGDFYTETPVPSGVDTSARRVLVTISTRDGAEFWAQTMDPSTLPAIDPTAIAAMASATPTASQPPATQLADGCGPSDLQPFDTVEATPGVQYGYPWPVVIREAGQSVSERQARSVFPALSEPSFIPSDLSLQLVLTLPKGSSPTYVELYYSADPIGQSENNFDWFEARTLLMQEAPTHGRTAQFVEQGIGAEAFSQSGSIVQVGPYEAAVVHDSALPNGVRRYDIYWSDGATDFQIGATTQPAEAVDVARSLYCAS